MNKVRIKPTLLSILLLSFLFLPISGFAGGEETADKIELAVMLDFYSDTAQIYFCNEDPFTLYYVQRFQQGIEDQLKAHLGGLLLTFKDGALVLEGLGIREYKDDDPSERLSERQNFQNIVSVKEMIAIDPFPVLMGAVPHDGSAQLEYHIYQQYMDESRLIDVEVNIEGDRTVVRLWTTVKTLEDHIRKEKKILLYELEYEADMQGIPWIRVLDLNGDGNEEIILGQMVWRRKTLYVFSSTPEKFNNLRELAETIRQIIDWKSIPCKGSEMFKKDYVKRIPLQ